MAIPPQYAKERWGCRVCGAYPASQQYFFSNTPEDVAEREAARQADEARRSQPGWTGPQRTTLPGGVWLCAEHARKAKAFPPEEVMTAILRGDLR